MSDDDVIYMKRAIRLAERGARLENCGPIGCVIVLNGDIIGKSYNEVDQNCDPTAHAEIMAIRRAGKFLKLSQFRGATLYSTLQPCGMCSMASIWAGVSRIVYGAERHQVHKMYFEDRDLDTVDFVRDAYKDDITILGGVLGNVCAKLYYAPDDTPPICVQTNV